MVSPLEWYYCGLTSGMVICLTPGMVLLWSHSWNDTIMVSLLDMVLLWSKP